MTDDHAFEPRLGRIGNRGSKRARSYAAQILAAVGGTRASRGGGRFAGSRLGRGSGVGAVLADRGARSAFARRRVVVKASIVRLAGRGAGGAAAHLRYLQRDGTTRTGDPGRLYGPESDDVDGKAFHARGDGDRHQFRFIVSPEDGAEYDELKGFTRRLMQRVAEDLGTKLDWVAVDHYNTDHPHSHVVVRGVDGRGADLVIARDYLTAGIRERAAELVDHDLGPRTGLDVAASLRREIGQERLTSIDRGLLRDMDAGLVVGPGEGDPANRALRAERLATLGRLELAEPVGGGNWRLAEDAEDRLRRMGERGDIIRTMQHAFARRGTERAAVDQHVYDPAAPDARPLVGRVVERGIADEHDDRHYLIVDAVDGRSHYVEIGRGADIDPVPEGATIRIVPRPSGAREVDRTIAAVAAANDGRYDAPAHHAYDPSASAGFVEAHVRRLEAMRRSDPTIERDVAGRWTIADDHVARAAAFEAAAARARPVDVEPLADRPVGALIRVEAASWLDRDLVARDPLPLREAGFGAEVAAARIARQRWLIEQGLATDEGGALRYAASMLATLQRRELLRVAGQLSDELGLPFAEIERGDEVRGTLRRSVPLLAGRFALVERSRDFTLVPWRATLERHVGGAVAGIVRDGGISWSVGRGRAGPTID